MVAESALPTDHLAPNPPALNGTSGTGFPGWLPEGLSLERLLLQKAAVPPLPSPARPRGRHWCLIVKAETSQGAVS